MPNKYIRRKDIIVHRNGADRDEETWKCLGRWYSPNGYRLIGNVLFIGDQPPRTQIKKQPSYKSIYDDCKRHTERL